MITCQCGPNMIVLGPVHRHQWGCARAMPSLVRLLTVIAILCAAVYGGLYALAHFVQPKPREISVSIPPDKFFKER
jgi:divalent metal cation (Fe/Co/Zn/Cd) transporter